MNILVYLKEVPPKEEQVKYQTAEGISDSDKNVLKEALNLRDQEGGTVTAMVIGPPEAEKTAREALTWGADRAVLVFKKVCLILFCAAVRPLTGMLPIWRP